MKNLLIFTSVTSPEFSNFWGSEGCGIVFNGKDYKNTKGRGWNSDKIEKLISSNDFLIFLHEGAAGEVCKRKVGNNQKLSYDVYYYTSQDISLTGDLWSWGKGKKTRFECDNPELPFDLLCCALRKNDAQKISAAKEEIFKWYNAKAKETEYQEQKLKYLSCCMSKETIKANSDIINNMDIFPEENRSEIGAQLTIMKKTKDFKTSDYQNAFMELCRILDEIT